VVDAVVWLPLPLLEASMHAIQQLQHASLRRPLFSSFPSPLMALSHLKVSATLPFDTRFFQMWGHVHLAGYNITLFDGATNDSPIICNSEPVYGTKEHAVGNELGYVVAMTKCTVSCRLQTFIFWRWLGVISDPVHSFGLMLALCNPMPCLPSAFALIVSKPPYILSSHVHPLSPH
jgi:hypothetical protein